MLDLRLSDAITKDEFIERRTLIDKEMWEVQEQLEIYKSRKKPTYDDVNNRIELLKYTLENNFNINNMDIPDSVIDALFKEVVVYKDRFVVKLNSTNDDYEVLSKATSPESEMMEITPSYVCTNTGCYRPKEEVKQKKYIYLMTVNVTYDDALEYRQTVPKFPEVKRFEDIPVDVYF